MEILIWTVICRIFGGTGLSLRRSPRAWTTPSQPLTRP